MPLIQAAIKLGDYIKKLSGINKEQHDIIEQIQDTLNKLPNFKKGLKAGYQLEITNSTKPPAKGKKIYWGVEIFNDVIEILSDYETVPKIKDRYEDIRDELSFFLIAGRPNKNETDNYEQWIRETSDPDSLLTEGYHMIAETNLSNKITRVIIH